ncbi:MAG: putative holin-like toxin [Bacillota bacterium]
MTTYETISLMVMCSMFVVTLISLIVAIVKAILGTKK